MSKWYNKKAKIFVKKCEFIGCDKAGTIRAINARTGRVISLCPEHYEYFANRNLANKLKDPDYKPRVITSLPVKPPAVSRPKLPNAFWRPPPPKA